MEIRLIIYTILIVILTSAVCVAAFNIGQRMNPILAGYNIRLDIRGAR